MFADCGQEYDLEYGSVNFIGKVTTFDQSIPAACQVGYAIYGDPDIHCQSDGTWSNNTKCRVKGRILVLNSWQPLFNLTYFSTVQLIVSVITFNFVSHQLKRLSIVTCH